VKKKVECFEDLFIWQKAIEFAKEIYLLTEKKGLKNDFGLKNQMRDSSVSISSNIAEGFERRSRKEYLNFLNYAKGSSGEIRSQLYVAFEVGYIEKSEMENLREKAKFLSGSITNHINSINITED
jgi:four helix bundle protein